MKRLFCAVALAAAAASAAIAAGDPFEDARYDIGIKKNAEALAIARQAKTLGLDVMVGNMMGSSLSMAPSYLVGQLCDIVDLDGPTFLARDRVPGVEYRGGMIHCPDTIWGHADHMS